MAIGCRLSAVGKKKDTKSVQLHLADSRQPIA